MSPEMIGGLKAHDDGGSPPQVTRVWGLTCKLEKEGNMLRDGCPTAAPVRQATMFVNRC
jgi:hypothetical protein